MKFASKRAARKRTSKKRPAPKALAAVADDFGLPESFAVEAGPAVSAETLLLLAIADVSTLVEVKEVDGVLRTKPLALRTMSFNNEKVGIEDLQMPAVLGRVAEGIGSERVTALIQKRLLTPPTAAMVVRDVYAQIQLWIDNPGLVA
jgi:hypothetical protein